MAKSIESIKAIKLGQVIEKTDSLINLGFSFKSKKFSLTQDSVIKLIGIIVASNLFKISFPIKWYTSDNQDSIDIIDKVMLDQFFFAAFGVYRLQVDSAGPLKDQINSADTYDKVIAVIDPR